MPIERNAQTGRLSETERTVAPRPRATDQTRSPEPTATEEIARWLPLIKETVDRTRRIETRLTTFMIARGMTPPTDKPRMSHFDSRVIVPSLSCTLQDVIGATPGRGRYELWAGGERIGTIGVDDEGYRQATTMPRNRKVASPDVLG